MFHRLRKLKRQLSNPYLLIDKLLKDRLLLCESYVSGHVADFGCGEFRLSFPFRKRMTALWGIDNWLASNYHRYAPKDTRFFYGSIEKTPFQDRSFDCVMCTEVLEHVETPERVVQEMARVLTDGGYLILSVPFNFFVHGAPNDFRRYTIYGLLVLLKNAKLELRAYAPVGNTSLALLNGLVTAIGFRKKMFLKSPAVVFLNIIGLLLRRLQHAQNLISDWGQQVNDRTQPLGYVLVAQKPIVAEKHLRPEEALGCPECHAPLVFSEKNISCSKCQVQFPYYEGMPVLASKENLHLEFEATGERVTL